MDAVRPDYDIGRRLYSVGESEPCPRLVLLEAHAFVAGADDFRRKPIDEHGEQVCPVHAVELDLAGERGRPHGCRVASIGAAELRIDPPGTKMEELVAQTKPLQRAHAVGLDGDAGANLGECRSLLVEADVQAALKESGGSSSTADAATDNRNAKRLHGHGNSHPL